MIWKAVSNLVFGFALVAFLAYATNHQPVAQEFDKPVAPNSAMALMEKCEPTTGIPGHVVIVPQNKAFVIYTANKRLIHQALVQEFDSGATTHHVYGFCK